MFKGLSLLQGKLQGYLCCRCCSYWLMKAFLLRYILSFSPQKYSDESTDTLKDEFLNGLSQFFKVGHMDMNLVSYTLSISKFLKYFMINISFLLKKWGSGLYIFLKLSVN